MHSLALSLGLTAGLYAFVFRHLALRLPVEISPAILLPAAMVVAWLVSASLGRRLKSENPPPTWISSVLVGAAAAYLALSLLQLVLYTRLTAYKEWALLVSITFLVRHLRPRMMLFAGVLGFAMQLGVTKVVGLLGALTNFEWLVYLITLVISIFVARWLSLGEESPADRVKKIGYLWFFGAAGLLSMWISADAFAFRSWTETLVWLGFFASFLLLANHLEPDDPTHVPSALGADYGLLFMVFIALYMTSASVFHLGDAVGQRVGSWMGLSAISWFPIILAVATTVAIMIILKLSTRLRAHAPGRRALKWGTVLGIIGVLAGGSVLGAGQTDGKVVDLLGTIVVFAVLAGPFLVAAQFLLGVGLVRMMFHLDPPPRD